jgi:hypothetical protein
MAAELHPHEVVYSSGLIISDPITLATLAIFYDSVALPSLHTDEYIACVHPREIEEMWQIRYATITFRYTGMDGSEYMKNEEFEHWDQRYHELFLAGALLRLSSPSLLFEHSESLLGKELSSLCPDVLFTQNLLTATNMDLLFIHLAQVEHLLRTDTFSPSVFLPSSRRSTREILKAFQAEEIFRAFLPAVRGDLPPQEILRLREQVRDTREGFALHLQQLSAEVQKGLDANAPLKDIARAASDIVYAKLIPDYGEFRRQIMAREAKFFGSLLDPLGKILAIDAAPWTPKFWGGFLSALGSAFGLGITEDIENLTNKRQAFQFMRAIDKAQFDSTFIKQ